MTPTIRIAVDAALSSRSELFRQLAEHPLGLDWCDRLTQVSDDLLRAIFEDVRSRFDSWPPLALIATGGYGRRELSPFSDVDLSLVPLQESHPRLDEAVKALFRSMQTAFSDEMRMEVGYAYRHVADTPGLDGHNRTALLDARFVVGTREAYDRLMRAYWDTFPVAEFLIDKLEERERCFAKYNDTPLAVEPHLKLGAGGLRCFQAANWLGAAIGERMSRPGSAYDHVITVRNGLHLVAGKHHDTLTRGRAVEVAGWLGVPVSEMSKSLCASLTELHADYARASERLHEGRFSLGRGAQAMRGELRIHAGADASSAALGVAFATRLGLRVNEFQAKVEPPLGPEGLLALVQGERTIRNLDRCGVLDTLLPELTACRYQVPLDAPHAYTVYEHSLRVVRQLDASAHHPFYAEIRSQLRDAGPLYLAALLHDAAKAVDEPNHSELGVKLVEEVGVRWRLPNETVEAASWLVREHLTMARFIRMRDVMHADTAHEFAALVQTPERLAMLTLLTWADIHAVAPDTWTKIQDSFTKELFRRTLSILSQSEPEPASPTAARRRLARRLHREEVPREALERFIDSLPAHYLLSTDPEQIRDHYEMAARAAQGEPAVEIADRRDLGATEVTVCCRDAPGLLSRLLGVFYALDCSLVGIRASTTSSDTPVALDVFTVTFGDRPVPQASARQLYSTLMAVVLGQRSVEEVLTGRGKDPGRIQEILTYTYREGEPGILEIRAPRGRGMAYRVSRTLAREGWSILSARVGQWAGAGSAAFYITNPKGALIRSDEVDRALQTHKV